LLVLRYLRTAFVGIACRLVLCKITNKQI